MDTKKIMDQIGEFEKTLLQKRNAAIVAGVAQLKGELSDPDSEGSILRREAFEELCSAAEGKESDDDLRRVVSALMSFMLGAHEFLNATTIDKRMGAFETPVILLLAEFGNINEGIKACQRLAARLGVTDWPTVLGDEDGR